MSTKRPWETAPEGSYWVGSGSYPDGGTFDECIIRALPFTITGTTSSPLFEVPIYGERPKQVTAAQIDIAERLILVFADDPRLAVYPEDQKHLPPKPPGPQDDWLSGYLYKPHRCEKPPAARTGSIWQCPGCGQSFENKPLVWRRRTKEETKALLKKAYEGDQK